MDNSCYNNKVENLDDQWIVGRFISYMRGSIGKETIIKDIKKAKNIGISERDLKIIVINLPNDKNLKRFNHILKILRDQNIV